MRARPSKRSNSNAIPTRSREVLAKRDRACFRCALAATDWHHRRSRRVRDDHTHCACNGVRLCRSCHDAVHKQQSAGRVLGLIVGRDEAEPGSIPVKGYMGWVMLGCDGGMDYREDMG